MASAIDPSKPTTGNPTTQSVRDNFTAAKAEIEALQQAITGMSGSAVANNPTFTGHLTLSSVGARIRGDFSNATAANMVAFQSNVLNGRTIVSALPNGVSKSASYTMYNGTDPANAQRGVIGIDATRVYTGSNYSGSPGVALPYDIDVGGANRVRVLPTGEVGIGVTPAVGQGVLQVPNINGAATSGFRNKIINGCCRIRKKGPGAAALGWNYFGADGISTYIDGWSAVTGTIAGEYASTDGKTSSGADHFVNLTAATGSSGYIAFVARIEAADALELQGKTVTASARVTSWSKQIDSCLIKIYKANSYNNFGAPTVIATSAEQGPINAYTTKDVSFSPALSAADCANGLQIEVLCSYTSTVTAAFHCFIADYQLCEGSQRMPLELRPIAIEEQLRRRYYRKQAVWVGTSTARTVMPIDMFGVPTITGGGTGFTSTGTDKDTLVCYQTTAGLQTLVLNSELV